MHHNRITALAKKAEHKKDKYDMLAMACQQAGIIAHKFFVGTTRKLNDLAGEPLPERADNYIDAGDIVWFVKDWLWDEFNESLSEHPGPIEDHYTDRNMYDFFLGWLQDEADKIDEV